MLPVAKPELGEKEKQALNAVIDSGWVAMGDHVAAFERAFARHHDTDDGVAVSSCTAGLHLSLKALGIGPGDEVLVPSLTFVATVNAVLYVGATPVFVDIESLSTPHMSITDAAHKCTSKTKAVILMHYGGYLMDAPPWTAFKEQYGISVIEDAAHAAGLDRAGTIADATVFSFFSNKNLTTAEGGMVLSRDRAVLNEIRLMRSHGMTTGTTDRHRGHALGYDVTTLGYNYRMDELRAAVGLVQLKHLTSWNTNRKELTEYYRWRLRNHCPEVLCPFDGADRPSCHHLMPVVLPKQVNRESIMVSMLHHGVQTSVHYAPVHLFSFYQRKYPFTSLPLTEEYSSRELTLPLYPSLKEPEVEHVVQALHNSLRENAHERVAI